MAKVTGLGHFGLFVQDMPKMIDFYTNVLGMTLTDRGMEDRIVFLSARPDEEHHEIALAKFGEDQKTDAGQISFHVESLQDLKALYRKLKDYGIERFRLTNHGASCEVVQEIPIRTGPIGAYLNRREFNAVRQHMQAEGLNMKRLLEAENGA